MDGRTSRAELRSALAMRIEDLVQQAVDGPTIECCASSVTTIEDMADHLVVDAADVRVLVGWHLDENEAEPSDLPPEPCDARGVGALFRLAPVPASRGSPLRVGMAFTLLVAAFEITVGLLIPFLAGYALLAVVLIGALVRC